jgi:hypothetical protein
LLNDGFTRITALLKVYRKLYIVIYIISLYKRGNMPEEVMTVVKIPIAEIEETVRAKHVLPKLLVDVRVEEDVLVLCFSDESKSEEDSQLPNSPVRKRRRTHRRRNRMKTRGWETVARITNSKGQKCTVYKPFVDALRDPKLTAEEQEAAVMRILKSNRNKPSETSVQYFLQNTLEYLHSQAQGSSQ